MNGRFSRLEIEPVERAQAASALEPREVGSVTRTPEFDMHAADEAFRIGQFELALQMYTKALGKRQSMVSAWVGQVQMLVELGENAEARLWADKSLELFRNNGDLLAAKSRACLYQGDQTAALRCSDASLQSPGCSPLRWEARGEVQLGGGNPRARDCFDKALADPAVDWFDRVIIARAYLRFGRHAPALEFASAATSLRPQHAYCWYVLGQCQESLGWIGKAAANYKHAIDLAPSLPQPKVSLRRLQNQSLMTRLSHRIGGMFRR